MSRKKEGWSWLLIAVMLIFVGAAALYVLVPRMQPATSLQLGDGAFSAQLARTDEEQIKGLSGTASLAQDKAMIFVFSEDGRWPIWMKDMRYPIDIVWLDKDKTVVYIVKNAAPDSYPKSFAPKEKARYVVELAAGTTDQKRIIIGRKAVFNEAPPEGSNK